MAILWVGIILTACATPAERIDTFARSYGLDRQVLEGRGFHHVVYSRHEGVNTLLVFLDGDGAPWFTPTIVALDPTPTNPLILRLLIRTKGAAVYIGRPCYLGLAQDNGCEPRLWTSARYSDRVIESLARVIEQIKHRHGYRDIILIGHSGGGALAMLLAAQMTANVRGVITMAANLDIDGWATYHGYTPLADSRNPAQLPTLPPLVYQAHFAGTKDRLVPPHITRAGLLHQPTARFATIDDVDHAGWERVWPQIQNVIDAWLTARR